MPSVYNKRHRNVPRDAVYIGRPSKWGNPYEIGKDGTREDVIKKYIGYMESRPDLVEASRKELKGKDLVCWCSPTACHGDILLNIANSEEDC